MYPPSPLIISVAYYYVGLAPIFFILTVRPDCKRCLLITHQCLILTY
ncbi:hypothetical protein BACPEC_01510 [[Bacteroides] pectinophilus ATCC 43243]|uniref:Uncharacterized protein n=1 Tax=[Bacteroides] pectinophilus ATCC 43243 TaxID=483218 RepID=B7ATN8_9FIRM|nr:hypothetical protein BACPEC_01510 [[Bacteroides] pectinophilus ATCC 43243]